MRKQLEVQEGALGGNRQLESDALSVRFGVVNSSFAVNSAHSEPCHCIVSTSISLKALIAAPGR